MKIRLLKEKYAIVGIPTTDLSKLDMKKIQNKFFSIIYEKDEISLIINEENWKKIKNDFKKFAIEKNFRILTFDEVLDWNITGFISKVGETLASKKIVVGIISAYSKDHLLIKNKDVKKAIKALKK